MRRMLCQGPDIQMKTKRKKPGPKPSRSHGQPYTLQQALAKARTRAI